MRPGAQLTAQSPVSISDNPGGLEVEIFERVGVLDRAHPGDAVVLGVDTPEVVLRIEETSLRTEGRLPLSQVRPVVGAMVVRHRVKVGQAHPQQRKGRHSRSDAQSVIHHGTGEQVPDHRNALGLSCHALEDAQVAEGAIPSRGVSHIEGADIPTDGRVKSLSVLDIRLKVAVVPFPLRGVVAHAEDRRVHEIEDAVPWPQSDGLGGDIPARVQPSSSVVQFQFVRTLPSNGLSPMKSSTQFSCQTR